MTPTFKAFAGGGGHAGGGHSSGGHSSAHSSSHATSHATNIAIMGATRGGTPVRTDDCHVQNGQTYCAVETKQPQVNGRQSLDVGDMFVVACGFTVAVILLCLVVQTVSESGSPPKPKPRPRPNPNSPRPMTVAEVRAAMEAEWARDTVTVYDEDGKAIGWRQRKYNEAIDVAAFLANPHYNSQEKDVAVRTQASPDPEISEVNPAHDIQWYTQVRSTMNEWQLQYWGSIHPLSKRCRMLRQARKANQA